MSESLADDVMKQLVLYEAEVQTGINAAVVQTLNQGRAMIKSMGGYKDRTGIYRASFAVAKEQTPYGVAGVLYSRRPSYRLTHLLENGHLNRDGTTRAKAFPHWQQTNDKMIKMFADRLTTALESGQP